MRRRFNKITIISTYTLTEDSTEDKDNFYNKLAELCEKTSKHDTLIITGIFNAKIGREEYIKEVAGQYSLHNKTSKNGARPIGNELWIKSVNFQHKEIHKGTWKAPGSK